LAQSGYCAVARLDDAIQMGAQLCIIASDTGRHLQDGLAALDRGLDVLVEKPLANDSAQAYRLNHHAKAAGRKLFVACPLRFSETLSNFRELLPRVGCLHSVRIEAQSYLPDWRPQRAYRDAYSARACEGGVLRDLIHEIDSGGWLFGWPSTLQARVRNLGRLGIAADEAADLSWETPAGCAVSVRLDYLSKPTRRRITAYGEQGTIEWDGIGQRVALMVGDQPAREFPSAQTRDDMFLAQALAFIQSVHCAPDPRLATGDDGVKALAVCDAARQASDSRQAEQVTYP
jgi:predicted dehydrogenase